MKSFLSRNGKWLVAIATVVLIAYFVWPTPWIIRDDGDARIHRFTGKVQYSGPNGWYVPRDPSTVSTPTPAQKSLSSEDLNAIRVSEQQFRVLLGGPSVRIVVENPTDRRIHGQCTYVVYDAKKAELVRGTVVLECAPRSKQRKTITLARGGDMHYVVENGKSLALLAMDQEP